MPHKLMLNKDHDEQVHEFETIEAAFDAAEPWIMQGYIARITDKEGVVQYTQTLGDGQIVVYRGDATTAGLPANRNDGGPLSGSVTRKPWWKFW